MHVKNDEWLVEYLQEYQCYELFSIVLYREYLLSSTVFAILEAARVIV